MPITRAEFHSLLEQLLDASVKADRRTRTAIRLRRRLNEAVADAFVLSECASDVCGCGRVCHRGFTVTSNPERFPPCDVCTCSRCAAASLGNPR